MKEDRLVVEATLGQALEPFDCKLGFLDFETIVRAVPVWPGMAPWEQAPAQFSYHESNGDGTYTHAEYLAEGPKDCRPELARAMVEATQNAEKVATYSACESWHGVKEFPLSRMERGSGGEDQYRRGCRPGVNELLRDRLHAEVESLQRARTKQREVARLTEDHVIPRSLSRHRDDDDARPALEHGPVRLAEPPPILALDA